MNASDIQNALDRIIKQNRNLDESGLRVLLLASSWESDAIESAINIFKARKDAVLSSLPLSESVIEPKVVEIKDADQVISEDGDLALKAGIEEIIDEVKVMEEGPVISSKDGKQENPKVEIKQEVSVVPEIKKEELVISPQSEAEELNSNEIVLPPSNKESSLGDLLSSSLKEIDKIPDKVFEDKRSKGIDLESAPILVKNDGISNINELKREAIKNVLEGKSVKPLPKEEVKIESKKEEVVLKMEDAVPLKKEEFSPAKELQASITAPNLTETKEQSSKPVKKEDETKVLIQSAEVASDHLIPDEETMEKEEKTSLIKDESPKKPTNKALEEIPHNLPLKPFDASPHVIPFSEYKETFHGKDEKVIPHVQNVSGVINSTNTVASVPVSVPAYVRSKKPVPLSKSEKELVVMASVLLFVILILLSYMYSNGRL